MQRTKADPSTLVFSNLVAQDDSPVYEEQPPPPIPSSALGALGLYLYYPPLSGPSVGTIFIPSYWCYANYVLNSSSLVPHTAMSQRRHRRLKNKLSGPSVGTIFIPSYWCYANYVLNSSSLVPHTAMSQRRHRRLKNKEKHARHPRRLFLACFSSISASAAVTQH